jgi:hypothetical protein
MAKKKLSDDYDITVDNMIDGSTDQEIGRFKLSKETFYNKKGKAVKMKVLRLETDEQIKQIFCMKDNTFVLEVETLGGDIHDNVGYEGDNIQYYQSNKLVDLVTP